VTLAERLAAGGQSGALASSDEPCYKVSEKERHRSKWHVLVQLAGRLRSIGQVVVGCGRLLAAPSAAPTLSFVTPPSSESRAACQPNTTTFGKSATEGCPELDRPRRRPPAAGSSSSGWASDR
jgi:hypothetical protein